MDKQNSGNFEVWATQAQNGDLKEAINLFIWQWGHPDLTLTQAEAIAVKFFDMIIETPAPLRIVDRPEGADHKP